jgi:exosortase J
MSASGSTRLVADGTMPSPFDSSLAAAADSEDQPGRRERVVADPMLWSLIGLLTLAGLVGLYPQLLYMWETWTTDPLRSVGIIILPTSFFLIVSLWRQRGWELRGSWWGLVLVALAFAPNICGGQLEFFWVVGNSRVNFIPSVLPIYLFTGGILMLFAGVQTWRKAWFPLALLLCLQPVPEAFVRFLDLPMQGFCAHTARSFASFLGFSPRNPELLRLMFTPDFGMFIAPGCDGMRGAVTLGYGALILGYLRRLSLWKWSMCVAGALLLGHVFNLIRLCALVLYYRVAVGHAVLENAAKQADYVIGALLFCAAASLFWILFMREGKASAANVWANSSQVISASDRRLTQWRAAVLALFVLVAMGPAVHAMRISSENLAWAMHRGEVSTTELNGRIPTQIGPYKLVRAWQERQAGTLLLETAAFEKAPIDEIELGIWLAPSDHSIQQSLLTHGETPKTTAKAWFSTAGGRSVPFNTALYDDGVTDTLTGDTYCSPSSCQSGTYQPKKGIHFAIAKTVDYTTRGKRVVPIFFKMQAPHTESGREAAYETLSAECQDFLSHLDLTQLSLSFQ